MSKREDVETSINILGMRLGLKLTLNSYARDRGRLYAVVYQVGSSGESYLFGATLKPLSAIADMVTAAHIALGIDRSGGSLPSDTARTELKMRDYLEKDGYEGKSFKPNPFYDDPRGR